MSTKELGNVILNIKEIGNKYESPDEFKDSYYKNDYLQAFKVIDGMIRQSREMLDQKENYDKDMNEKLYQYQEICNILPFIGKRGTGKTSAMLSFAGALNSYDRDILRERDILYKFSTASSGNPKPIRFICLDCIDGSLLEQGEDIFKVILAQMYRKFLEFDEKNRNKSDDYDYQKRKLQQEFDNLYRNICKIENGNRTDAEWEESPITSLKNLSDSTKIKKDFGRLVLSYLNMFQYGQKLGMERYEQFLVIIIDDIDLNINGGFEMMEKIHRYMMVPGVFVLASMHYEQMRMLCEKHFFQMIPKVDKLLIVRSEKAERLAQDFLDKVIPYNVRVYMPILKRCSNLSIEIKNENKNLDIKAAIFRDIYLKTGIRLDFEGVKRHFYEPETMRELTSFYLMLNSMRALDAENGSWKDDFLKICVQNHHVMLNDALQRLAGETLDLERNDLFLSLIEQRVERACRKTVYYTKKLVMQPDSIEAKKLGGFAADIEEYEYSYGELMRVIYCWGRVNDDYKKLIKAFLAYYSIELSRLYYQYIYTENESDKNNIRGMLLEVLNGSFTGSWTKKMFPQIEYSGLSVGKKTVPVGSVPDIEMNKIMFSICCEGLEWKEEEAPFKYLIKQRGTDIEELDEIGSVRKIFRTVVTLCMFFEHPYYQNQPFQWELMIKSNGPKRIRELAQGLQDIFAESWNEKEISLYNRSGTANFNLLGFAANAFQYKETVDMIETSLCKQLLGVGDADTYKKISRQLGIKEEFEEWEKKYGGFVFPIYDLDFCYNMMKRVRQKMFSLPNVTMKTDKIIEYFFTVLTDTLKNSLKTNDTCYESALCGVMGTDVREDWKISFLEAYEECPVVKWMLHKEEYLLAGFDHSLGQLIESVAQGRGDKAPGDHKDYKITPGDRDKMIYEE